MDTRLSDESLRSVLDGGHQSLPWEPGQPSGFLAGVDIDMILASPNARAIVQSMPTQPLYYAMKQRGLADCLDILPMLTREQVIRVMDYDVWDRDMLVPKKAFELLNYFAEIGPKELYRRFAYLDEEFQVAVLSGFFKVYEEVELEDLPEDLQDRLYAMPCNKVFYEICTEDADERRFLETLIEAAKEQNLRYAYSLIGHASYLPPGEQEFQLLRFRKARLEEDGFVPYEESLQIFTPINRLEIKSKWQIMRSSSRQGALASAEESSEDFLGLVLRQALIDGWDIDEQFEIHQRLLYLANAMCSAAGVEPDDVYGLHRVLEQCKAVVGLGLDYISQTDVPLALQVIKGEHPQNLFRIGMSLIEDLRQDAIKQIVRVGLPEAASLEGQYLSRRWGAMLLTIDRELREILGFESSELLKGLFNRFPMAPKLSQDRMNVHFLPVSSLAVYHSLQQELWGLLALLESVQIAEEARKTQYSMNKLLMTAMLQSISDQRFISQPLTLKQIEDIQNLGGEAIDDALTQIQAALQLQLQERFEYWAPSVVLDKARRGWALEAASQQLRHLQDDLKAAIQTNSLHAVVVMENA